MKIEKNLLIIFTCFSFGFLHTQPSTIKILTPPFFTAYPKLVQHIPYLSLGTFPTPLYKAEKLASLLNIKELFIKQEEFAGKTLAHGQVLPGGSKVRKLEILLADAITRGFDTILTIGPAGSHHVTTTAMYAKELGLKSILMLTPQPPTSDTRRNLLLDLYADANIFYYSTEAQRTIALTKLARAYNQKGINLPYYIPMGGSCELGCIGFINAIFELKEQIKNGLMQEPDYIFVTLCSASTAAGIILGALVANLKSKIIPVQISCNIEYKANALKDLINQTSIYLHSFDTTFPLITINENDLYINNNFVGTGYAHITPEAVQAIELLQKYENIKLDGTYTGKAFAALVNEAIKGIFKDKTVLFWDTYSPGNYENFTASMDYKKLPQQLQHYFTTQLQPLDQGY